MRSNIKKECNRYSVSFNFFVSTVAEAGWSRRSELFILCYLHKQLMPKNCLDYSGVTQRPEGPQSGVP